MKALKKKKQPTFSIPCFKMCVLFSFGVIQQSDLFFFNRKKRKEMSDLSVMKVMTCFSPRWDFHAPVRAAAGGVMFSGYPSICPVLTIVISPEEFQIWPNSSLRLKKTNSISIQHFIFKEVTGQLPRDVTMLPKPSTLQILIHHHSCRDCVPNWHLEGY